MWDRYSSFSEEISCHDFWGGTLNTHATYALMYTSLYSYLQFPNVHVHMLHIADFARSIRFSHCTWKSSRQRVNAHFMLSNALTAIEVHAIG